MIAKQVKLRRHKDEIFVCVLIEWYITPNLSIYHQQAKFFKLIYSEHDIERCRKEIKYSKSTNRDRDRTLSELSFWNYWNSIYSTPKEL